MKMKQTMLAILAMSSVASVAHADINVINNDKGSLDVYGTLDAAVGNQKYSYGVDSQFSGSVNPYSPIKVLNNSAAAGQAPSTVTGLFNGGISPSRFGIKGGLDVNDGMKTFFVLESGIDVTTGQLSNAGGCLATNSTTGTGTGKTSDCSNSSVNGQIFSRAAYVGLSDTKLGSLALGRNYAPIYDVTTVYDPVQNAQLFSPLGFSGTVGGGGGISEDTRVDGSLKYTNKWGSFNYGALLKPGGSSATASSAKSAYALNAGYEEGAFAVQGAYESFRDGVKGASDTILANTVAITVYNTNAFMLGAKYKFNDAATAKIGYETYTLSAPSDYTSNAAVAAQFTSYYGQAICTTQANCTVSFSGAPQTTRVMWIGGDYNFTPKLNVAAGLYQMNLLQSSDFVASTINTGPGTGQASGYQRYVSFLVDYHITKSLDTYAGLMYSTYGGNQFPTTNTTGAVTTALYYSQNNIVAAGMRFKF